MPVNKNAYIRYLTYDRCLRTPGKRYKWTDLKDAANRVLETQSTEPIGKTQFFKDIQALKGPPWNAPIVSKDSYYIYSVPGYSITNSPLNDSEAEQIKSALTVLTRFKGLPQFEWVQEVIPKIQKQFNLGPQENEIISFDQNVDLKGLDNFGRLFDSIVYQQVLSIEYRSFKSTKPLHLIIHPYYLKQYNNRWFLFGYNPSFDDLSNLPLDRIVKIEQIEKEVFIENSRYDFNEYFEDMIGVSRPIGIDNQKIKLWFSPDQAPYIDTKPLHGTQKIISWDDTGMIIAIDVIPNIELEQIILKYGEKCKVLEPLEIAKKIAIRLTNAQANYNAIR